MQTEEQPQPVMGINLSNEAMMLTIAEPMMNQIVLKWLEAHEELASMFVTAWMTKQQDIQSNIAMIEQVRRSKRGREDSILTRGIYYY